MTDAFTKPVPDPAFDLDAWISGARLPERSVTVYGRADLVGEYEELDARLRAAKTSDTAVHDDRLNSDEVAVAHRMAAVREEMAGSALTFRFRALGQSEQAAITKGAPKDEEGDPDGPHVAAHWLAAASVAPKLTVEQATMIRARIGEGQYAALWETAFGVSNAKRVDVPFSLAASAALSRRDS